MRGLCVMPRPVRWDAEGLRLRKEPMLGREESGGDGREVNCGVGSGESYEELGFGSAIVGDCKGDW